MRVMIANIIGLFLQDRIRKTRIRSTTKFLQESQRWTEERLHDYKLSKLKSLIEHSEKNNAFYNNILREKGIASKDIQSLDDFKKLPILNKDMLRQQNDIVFSTLKNSNIKYGKTGGTTGVPLYIAKDASTRSFGYGAYYRWFEWIGIRLGDPVVMLWGDKTVLSKSLKQKILDKTIALLFNRLVINAFNLNKKTLDIYIHKIIKQQPKMIGGYLSAILQLASYIKSNQINIPSIIAIYTTTETLLPPYKKFIEEVFAAPVYDQYGCGECGSIAYECPCQLGLHINEEHVILEVLDEYGNDIYDKPGRIVVTDLDNLAMPIIRYENGDTGIKTQENLCKTHPNYSILKEISGRSADTITLKDNSKVHGVFFTDVYDEIGLFKTAEISRFQVYQVIAGEIELRIESVDALNPDKLRILEKALYRYFNRVEIRIMPTLEVDPSGKFRYIISSL